MKRPQAFRISCLRVCSLGQPAPRVYSRLISPRLCSKNREMSWSIIAGWMFWSTKSWCSDCGIRYMPCRIEISGLLVRKTRSRLVFNDRASPKSCRIIRIWSSLSHSSGVEKCTDWNRCQVECYASSDSAIKSTAWG
jgi:hypothetical protein